MPDYAAFYQSRGKAGNAVSAARRAADVARMIQDRPTSITLKRGATVLDGQTVLATQERSGAAQDVRGEAGTAGIGRLMLLGVQNHATLDDFDVKRGDRFSYGGMSWHVAVVQQHVPGVIEAHCEGVQ